MVRITVLKTNVSDMPKNPPKKPELPKTEALTSKLFFGVLAGINTFAGFSCLVMAMKATSLPQRLRLALYGQLFGIASSICYFFHRRAHWNQDLGSVPPSLDKRAHSL